MLSVSDLVKIALFAAIFIIFCSLPPIPIPLVTIPITAQTFCIMFLGAFAGPTCGFLSILSVLLLVAAGLPLLPGGRAGLAVFMGPSSGYLLSFPFAAGCVGYLCRYFRNDLTATRLVFCLIIGCIFPVHIAGLSWLVSLANVPFKQAFLGSLIFIPADLVKVFFACFVIRTVHKALPNFMH